MDNSANLPAQKPSRLPKISRQNLLISAILIILIGFGVYFGTHSTNKKSATAQHYTKTSSLKVDGTKFGSAMTFNVPSEFGAISQNAKESAAFSEMASSKNGAFYPTSEMGAYTQALSYPYTNETLQAVNKIILGPEDAAHKFMKGTQDYVSRAMAGYTVSLGAAKAYSTANIKSNAWEIDLTATSSDSSKKDTHPDQQGKIVYVIGQKGYYYLYAMTVNNNWTDNQKAWEAVLNSLKIDQ